jgi:hypothetical protein
MDDQRFDAFVRAWAGRVSRREVLHGVGASAVASTLVLLRTGAAGAHHALIPLGGACRHTNQCQHHATLHRSARVRPNPQAVHCADNGFRYDGPLNCCRHLRGSCTRDEHCCGSRHFCRSRVCTYLR